MNILSITKLRYRLKQLPQSSVFSLSLYSYKKISRKLLIIFLIFLTNTIYAHDFNEIAKDIMEQNNIPEMTFAVVTKDSVLIKNTIGHHKITELKKKPNANIKDYFQLGSNTKAITGFIAASLVENQKIKWNTKFFDLFPELKNNSNNNYYNITLEGLLTHRAKIPPFDTLNEILNAQKLFNINGKIKKNRFNFVKYILTLPSIEINYGYKYSNAGYSIAAVMLEKVSGKSWEDLCNDILRKKMDIDFIFERPNHYSENQPFGHLIDNDKLIPVLDSEIGNARLFEPAGGLSMNIENYAKFIQLNLHGLSKENNFLTADTYQFLHSAKEGYAIGWGNKTSYGRDISDHLGSDGTFYSSVKIDREKLMAFIVIVNSGSRNARRGVYEMMDKLETLRSHFIED